MSQQFQSKVDPVTQQILHNFTNGNYPAAWFKSNLANVRRLQKGESVSKPMPFFKGWKQIDFELFFNIIEALEAKGFEIGGGYSKKEIVAEIDQVLEATPPQKPQRTTARGDNRAETVQVNKISKTAQRLFIESLNETIKKSLELAQAGDLLGMGNPTLRTSPIAQAVEVEAKQQANTRVIHFLKGAPQTTPKFALYWERFIPSATEEQQEILEKAAISFPIDSLQNPTLRKILAEESAAGIYDQILSGQKSIARERELLEDWKTQRPEYWEWAHQATEDYLDFNYKNKSSEEHLALRDQIRIARMSGFRILDAHFTGKQTFDEPVTYRKARFQFVDTLDAKDRKTFENNYGFIQLGNPKSVRYGANTANPTWHQMAMSECSFTASKSTDIKFQPDHFVSQIAQLIHPILAMQESKVIQKGLVGYDFLAEINQLALTSNDAKHLRVTSEEIEQLNLSEQELALLGINPFVDVNRARAAAITRKEIGEFNTLLDQPETQKALVDQKLYQSVLEPVIATQMQIVFIETLKGVNPTLYKELISTEPADEMDRVNKRCAAFERAVREAANNQQKAIGEIMASKGIEPDRHQFQPVQIDDPRVNWKHLPEYDKGKGVPNGWFLLKDHIHDMTKDGLSKRIIKMAGAYSVVDPEIAVEVVSRCGRSERHEGMTRNGRLLVYPNPLIFFEQHSKTDRTDKKYVAPDGSCNPPLVVAAQAKFTDYNGNYLQKLNGPEQQKILQSLQGLRDYEMNQDKKAFTSWFEHAGFGKERSETLGVALYNRSTSRRLYDAIDDQEASVEITEGQKKTYKMYQSYKELIEAEEEQFVKKLSPTLSDEQILEVINSKPQRSNKLFVCSPGVWLPVKGWKSFSSEEKKEFLESTGASDMGTKFSPLNQSCKHALTPPWINMINMTGRDVTITYDSDSQFNVNVAQSVSAMAQAIKDAFPNSRLNYRLIVGEDESHKLGADDYLVKYGNQPFWDTLAVKEVAPNVSWKELDAQIAKSAKEGKQCSLLQYLIDKRAKMGDLQPEALVLQ